MVDVIEQHPNILNIFQLKISSFLSRAYSTDSFVSVFVSQVIRLYRPLFLLGPLDCVQCPNRAGECRYFLIGQK